MLEAEPNNRRQELFAGREDVGTESRAKPRVSLARSAASGTEERVQALELRRGARRR